VDQKPRLTPGEQRGTKREEEVEYIPTSERMKMEPLDTSEEDIREQRAQDRLAWGMLAALLLVAVMVGVNMARQPAESPAEEEPVAQTEELGGGADSLAQDTTAAATTPEPPAPAPEKKPPTQTAQSTGGPTVTPTEPEPPPTPFGIVVGSYLNEARAQEEATKLKGATSLDSKIEPFDDGGVTSYRVVLGSFPNRAAAERKANDLIGQDLVYEARVAPLK